MKYTQQTKQRKSGQSSNREAVAAEFGPARCGGFVGVLFDDP
jgi:hypothetical protein